MKVSLIAEFCQNHNGNLEVLKEMIASAARAQFTHGKIQGLYSSELTKRKEFENPSNPIFRPYNKEVERLSGLDLSEADEHWFVEECKAKGITPMITVFSHDGVRRAKNAGFRSIKIASYDCSSLKLIERVADFADEIVVSTGATSWNSVMNTSQRLLDFERRGIKVGLLHARTVYPAKSTDAGLARMLCIEGLGVRTGFSDHSLLDESGLLATKFALLLGAEIIERHYTVLPRNETKDGPVSIDEGQASTISEFANLNRREKIENLGENMYRLGEYVSIANLEPTEIETMNATYYRGRVASRLKERSFFSWEDWPE